MHYRVALFSPPYAMLTYSAPAWLPESLWKPGLRVAVPLGNGAVRAGIILGAGDEDAADLSARGVIIRSMVWPLEAEPLLQGDYLETITQLAARQSCPPGKILGSVLPQGLRTTGRIRIREFVPGGKPVIRQLRDVAALSAEALSALGNAYMNGRAEVLALKEDAAATEMCRLDCEPPWPVRPNALRQRQVLDYLLQRGTLSRRRLSEALPDCASALSALLKARLITLDPVDEADVPEVEEGLLPPASPPFELSTAQKNALAAMSAALDSGKSTSFLLFGVTGSGKTAVYLELALQCLQREKSALLLAPEVALALKLRRDVVERFPETPVFLFHGYQSPARREAIFREIASRKAPCLVIGTRSALFLPLPALGAVILDEEHDGSFKQDEGFHYQAKEVAWQRAASHNALLVLGSATPDVKTYHAARSGQLPLSRLADRVGGGTLPHIQLVDIRESPKSNLLAAASIEALKDTVRRGEQAVVLLNRRGYAPLMYCLDCGKAAKCPHCDIGLTYHKRREQLVCHYCGFTRPFPSPCAHCDGLNYHPIGEGTERLEERLASEELADVLAGGGRILRLDRDSARSPDRMEAILTAFARQEAQILVGTQMLSKGHHFPNVTLAVIADADLGLNLPDYRAAERTFQLLVQSAGRAGRGDKPGNVLIQTRDISHYCWKYVQDGDYEGFFREEIAMREKRRYPPFVKLSLIRVSYPFDFKDGLVMLNRFGAALKEFGRQLEAHVLGPAPAPLARLQGRLRFQWLVKTEDWLTVRQIYGLALKKSLPATPPREWRISLDLDPVNML